MHPKKKKAVIIFVVTLVLAFILLFYLARSQNSQQALAPTTVPDTNPPVIDNSQSSTTTTVTTVTVPQPVDTSKYKNGTYTAMGNYFSPAGPESINVSITISNDVVTSSSVTPLAQDGRSMGYQEMFINAYKQYVIGKNIDSIDLVGDISGSSLTPKAFDNALNTIKQDALVS